VPGILKDRILQLLAAIKDVVEKGSDFNMKVLYLDYSAGTWKTEVNEKFGGNW
jgi:hypothetical protein